MKIPYSEQFSLSIQRWLPWNLDSETAYVGSLGRRLLTEPDINQPTWLSLVNAQSTANINTLRPYAGYWTIQQFQSVGTSNYHGLQVKLTRRAGNVLFNAPYKWAKNLCDSPSDTENNFNVYNRKAFYGPCYSGNAGSSVDVRHAFVGTFTWDLPKLLGRPVDLRAPLGCWQFSTITRMQSGSYYSIVGSTAILGTRLADYVGGPTTLPNRGPNGWINPAAFTSAPQARYGNSGAGNVEGPGLQLVNMSVPRMFNSSRLPARILRERSS